MDETLDSYEETGMPIPLDIQVEAIEIYGFILTDNYPQEDI
tara:strand:- start:3900 stop:4022 length:123 start_codon:yes stop_codon:yes gene_type:complete